MIWTTTPWTLPANQAVAVHQEFDYALLAVDVGAGEELLILAAELAPAVLARAGIGSSREIARVKGEALEHLQLRHPFYERGVPVILGDHVTLLFEDELTVRYQVQEMLRIEKIFEEPLHIIDRLKLESISWHFMESHVGATLLVLT